MPAEYTEQDLTEKWTQFFNETHDDNTRHQYQQDYYAEIVRVAMVFPDERSIKVNYNDIARFDSDLADYVLDEPHNAIFTAQRAMEGIMPHLDRSVDLRMRLTGLPHRDNLNFGRVSMRQIRNKHVNKFVALEGMVKLMTEPFGRVVRMAWVCAKCNCVIINTQIDGYHRKEPTICDKDQGGCGKSANQTSFKPMAEAMVEQGFSNSRYDLSESVDSQNVEIQEMPEGLSGTEQPRKFVVVVEEDLVGTLCHGQKVVINGIVRSKFKMQSGRATPNFELYLYANSIESSDDKSKQVLTKDEEHKIIELASSPTIYEMIIASIAPSVHGQSEEKLAIAMQLFGGVKKILADGSRVRGDIHILLVGDPGVAKTHIMKYVAELAPRGIFATGKGTSGPGLTAAAVMDKKLGEGRWTLEAGVVVMANLGIACIDEIQLMSKEDRSSMHEAMESQSVTINKADLHMTLPAQCSILAAANPKSGRWEKFSPVPNQIDMTPALLSRFDAIYPVKDEVNKVRDTLISNHMMTTYREAVLRQRDERGMAETTVKQGDTTNTKPVISKDLLRKYIQYARDRCMPVMSQEAQLKITSFYTEIRIKNQSAYALTPRQVQAVIRFAEASAKIRLSDVVTEEDADRAIGMITHYLTKVAMDNEGNVMDIDMVYSGVPLSQRDKMVTVRDIVQKLSFGGESAALADIMRECEIRGMLKTTVTDCLARLKQEGRIFEPQNERYKFLS